MIWDLEPADRPAGLLPEDADVDLLVLVDSAQVGRAVADLELLGDGQRRLEADRHVVGHVVAPDRQDARVERRALLEQREVDRAGADVGHGDPELLLGLIEDGIGRGQGVHDELVDLDAGRGHALGQVLDRRRGRRDDVGLDLEPQRAHAERVLDALLAVDAEPAPLDMEDLAVGRDRHGPGDLDRSVHVLARDLAVVTGHGDLSRRVEAFDVLPADADEGAVDLPARQALGALDRVRDGADRLVDVDDDALLEAGRGDGPVAHDRQPPVATHLADERADLAGADVDADEDRFSFHRFVRLRVAAGAPGPRGSGVG